MIRLQRASVIATLSLLAWATTASAECAWIWWGTTFETVEAIGGYTTKQECEKALRFATSIAKNDAEGSPCGQRKSAEVVAGLFEDAYALDKVIMLMILGV